jgi:hypothetical protein
MLTRGQLIEVGASDFVLVRGPIAHGWIGAILEPLIVVHHACAVVVGADRFGGGAYLTRARRRKGQR